MNINNLQPSLPFIHLCDDCWQNVSSRNPRLVGRRQLHSKPIIKSNLFIRAACTALGLGIIIAISSFSTRVNHSRQFMNSWLVCSGADHSDAFTSNTVRVSTPRTVRTGNHIRFYRWAITEAVLQGCHIILPKQISTLDVLSNCSMLFNTRVKYSTNCGARRLISDYDTSSEFRTTPAHVRSTVRSSLRAYTSSMETQRDRYAYGKLCPKRQYSMIHVRSGDTNKGKFSASGNWEPEKTHSQYAPFPISYYISAFFFLVRLNHQIVVVCEDAQSSVCSFFQHIKSLYSDVLQVRLSDSLLRDLQEFTCSAHVVASRGSFHESFNLHESQILHDFVDHKVSRCAGNKVYYFVRDQSSDYAQRVVNKWMNNDLQRWLVNQPVEVQVEDCRQFTY